MHVYVCAYVYVYIYIYIYMRLPCTTFWCCGVPNACPNPTVPDLVNVELPFSLDVERVAPEAAKMRQPRPHVM